MAIRKIIWVSGQALPTISNDFEVPAQSASYTVISSDYIQATYNMISIGANSYRYDDMTSISDYVVQSGDYLEYDVYWESAGNIQIAVDLNSTVGALRGSTDTDQNGFLPHPNVDISSKASGLWYHRKISLAFLLGGTIQQWDLVCENDTSATFIGRFKNILITDGNETTTTSTSSSTSASTTSQSTSTSRSTSTSVSTSTTTLPFDFTDYSLNTNNLTNSGATNVTSSLPFLDSTNAVAFTSAASARLTAPDDNSLDITNTISIEFWVKVISATAFMAVLSKGHDSNAGDRPWNYIIDLGADGVSPRFYYTNSNNYNIYELTANLTVGVWTHLALTYTFASGSSAIWYVNGSSSAAAWTTGNGNVSTAANTDLLRIGDILLSGSESNFLNGQLDEIRIYKDIRTPTEIANNYNVELTDYATDTNLQAYYPFESNIGTTTSTSSSSSTSSTSSSVSNSTSQSTSTTSISTSSTSRSTSSTSQSTSTTTMTARDIWPVSRNIKLRLR